jgi:16S rRNA processing protein RimM
MAHVCLGEITGPHGVRGEVRIRSFAARPEDVAAYGPLADEAGARNFEIKITGMARGAVLARIAGVADRSAAEALRGTRLYVARDKLPQPEAGEFYRADLVGLVAARADGTPVGRVVAVENFGASDVLEIAPDEGDAFFLPFTADAVPDVDMAVGRVTIEEAFAVRHAGREPKNASHAESVEGRAAR